MEVVVEHDGERALPGVTSLGGSEGGALPGGAGLAGGCPGADHAEQLVRLFRGHTGLKQSLPGHGHQFGNERGGGKCPGLVPVPGWSGQLGRQAVLSGTVEIVIGALERQRVGPLRVLPGQAQG